MAAKEDVREAKALDIAGTAPVVTPVPSRILTEEDAKALLSTYMIPSDVKKIYVTEDCNVFWEQYKEFAFRHAQHNNLKIFTIDAFK